MIDELKARSSELSLKLSYFLEGQRNTQGEIEVTLELMEETLQSYESILTKLKELTTLLENTDAEALKARIEYLKGLL